MIGQKTVGWQYVKKYRTVIYMAIFGLITGNGKNKNSKSTAKSVTKKVLKEKKSAKKKSKTCEFC